MCECVCVRACVRACVCVCVILTVSKDAGQRTAAQSFCPRQQPVELSRGLQWEPGSKPRTRFVVTVSFVCLFIVKFQNQWIDSDQLVLNHFAAVHL